MKTPTLMRTLALLALAACSGGGSSPPAASRPLAATLMPVANDKLDLLFMIDDSPGALDYEDKLKSFLHPFMTRLNARATGFPDVHIGVVTSDLGASAAGDAMPGPSIGSGPGACIGTGKNGVLQSNSAVMGSFIIDEPQPNSPVRTTNYSGALEDALGSLITGAGNSGCGFEQHLEAVRRGLENTTENQGFLRPDANLAIVLVGDEDDCSMEHATLLGTDTTTLGPLQSFRCTRFGITCDDGGTTTNEMNTPGPKGHCHSNEQSQYLTHLADYKAFLDGLKPDPSMIMLGTIVGNPEPVEVELRSPPGGGTQIPALTHSCQSDAAGTITSTADPAVRDNELASMFDRHVLGSICPADLSSPLVDTARQILSMTGSPCLVHDIAEPHDCTAADDSGPVEACDASHTDGCYTLVTDETMCPEGQHLRVDYVGTQTSKLTLSCKLP